MYREKSSYKDELEGIKSLEGLEPDGLTKKKKGLINHLLEISTLKHTVKDCVSWEISMCSIH